MSPRRGGLTVPVTMYAATLDMSDTASPDPDLVLEPTAGLGSAASHKSRMALEELREFAELRLRAADKEVSSRAALERVAAARAANLTSRSRSILAMALYVGALGAQVLLIAVVHLFGI
jgi:hypothetical protein